jgi:hypothetical protein
LCLVATFAQRALLMNASYEVYCMPTNSHRFAQVVSVEAASDQGAGSDGENPSDGFGDNENAFDSGRHVKIGVEATLAGVSYDIGQSIVLKAHVTSLESFPCYFLKGFAQLPSAEFVPYPWENEVVVFEDFFAAGLRIPPYPILLDILCKF